MNRNSLVSQYDVLPAPIYEQSVILGDHAPQSICFASRHNIVPRYSMKKISHMDFNVFSFHENISGKRIAIIYEEESIANELFEILNRFNHE